MRSPKTLPRAPTLLGTLGVSRQNGLNVDYPQTDVGGASLSHWNYYILNERDCRRLCILF